MAPNVGASVSPVAAKRWVITSLTVGGVLLALRDVRQGHVPSIRLGVGLLFSGVFLTFLAEAEPRIAAPLSLLLLTVAVVNSEDVLKAINNPKSRSEAGRASTITRAAAGSDALSPAEAAAVREYVAQHPNP